jgi:predicted metal-dependent enzyme (double-stranded beta helix superfamily)
MRSLVEQIRAVVAKGPVDAAALETLQDVVRGAIPRLAKTSICTRDLAPGRYLCYRDADFGFVVMVLVWGDGSGTPIHDHGTWGVEAVLANALRVTTFCDSETNPQAQCTSIVKQGDVMFNLPPARDVHRVEYCKEHSVGRAVSLHVYGREMSGNRMFVPGEGFKCCALQTNLLETEFDFSGLCGTQGRGKWSETGL